MKPKTISRETFADLLPILKSEELWVLVRPTGEVEDLGYLAFLEYALEARAKFSEQRKWTLEPVRDEDHLRSITAFPSSGWKTKKS